MKKFGKIGAVLIALVFGLFCFVACSNNSGGGSDNGGGTNSGGGNSNNEEVETPKATVVAEYQYIGLSPYIYIFYSDGTYEYKASQQTMEKGIYSGNPTKRGTITMQRQYFFDDVSGTLISNPSIYSIVIDKNEKDDLSFIDDVGDEFFLN